MQSLIAKSSVRRFALARSFSAKSATPYASVVPGNFTGTIEGLGNTISHLSLTGNGASTGLFALLGSPSSAQGAKISNLHLQVALSTTDGSGGGALAGAAYNSTITNVTVSGTIAAHEPVSGGRPLGGLVGTMSGGAISLCASTASVTASGPRATIGGLLGAVANGATIDSSFSIGTVSAGPRSVAGGLVGSAMDAVITNSFVTATVSALQSGSVGGLIGVDSGSTLQYNYAAAPIGHTGNTQIAGALIGREATTGPASTDLVWDASITGTLPAIGAGGTTTGMSPETSGQLTTSLPPGFSTAIWTQSPSVNSGYPYPISLPPP